ncbi:MAG: Uma2 family endonuclease [Leptolyngbyaceae cyanobacterium CSU_1_3]|nr:Uma2 family endonuclease [Leptolyngbyaceae cyanobacterium CSU_1_3]
MTIASLPTKTYTPDEYLDLEVKSETRSEYRNGEIIQMTGGTPTHNELIRALTVALSLGLHRKPYQLFLADQRLWIPEPNIYTYPDVMIVPRPVELKPGRKDTVMNPIVIAEVLSDSTEAYDRGEKFAAYRTIETFQEYLLIDQSQPHLEQYVKQSANQWLFTEYNGLESKVMLATVQVEIALADLYENVEFAERLVGDDPKGEEMGGSEPQAQDIPR